MSTRRTATLTLKAPTGAQPTDIAGIEAAGAAWWGHWLLCDGMRVALRERGARL